MDDVIANAKPPACAINPYAGAAGEAKKTFAGGALVARLIAMVVAPEYAAAWTAAAWVSAAIAYAAELEDQEDKKRQADAASARERAAAAAAAEEMQENIKKLKEKQEELEARLAAAEAAAAAATTPAPAPKPQERCNRFSASVSGSQNELTYKRKDGGVIGILDAIKACRCKARKIESPSLSTIMEPDGSECQSDADRRRADCARNPFDEVDRPRKECIDFLMEDNPSFNLEARLCSAVQCTRDSKAAVGLSANRVLGCGCFIPESSRDGSTRPNLCARMMCQGECVCRGTQCACEGGETRIIPHTPPAPPVQPIAPEGLPGIPPRPPLP
jgi:hypothetical protein